MEALKIVITVIQLILAVGLTVIIMFQSGKSNGLSAAIAGGSESFMSKNKNKGLDAKLARATKWIAAAFVILTFVLSLL
jgi:preprotein translocase subunit SecG